MLLSQIIVMAGLCASLLAVGCLGADFTPRGTTGPAAPAQGIETATPAATVRPRPTVAPTPRPTPIATAELRFTVPQPTSVKLSDEVVIAALATVQATRTKAPRPTPRPAATPTPGVPPDQLMLELINQGRADAGVGPVSLGNNQAAQGHANAALKHCLTGHWGVDGLRADMRYRLAGGDQNNAENVSGINTCADGPNHGSIERDLRVAMTGFMESPGHRAVIINPHWRRVSIGIATSGNRMPRIVQVFESDYTDFTAPPQFQGGVLSFSGKMKNGAALPDELSLKVDIYYDPQPSELTRGQIATAYCQEMGELVGALRPAAPPGSSYSSHGFTLTYSRCRTPYEAPADSPAPQSREQAYAAFEIAKSNTIYAHFSMVDWVDASTWQVGDEAFAVSANISSLIQKDGLGVYKVVLWATVAGQPVVVSQYPIFVTH